MDLGRLPHDDEGSSRLGCIYSHFWTDNHLLCSSYHLESESSSIKGLLVLLAVEALDTQHGLQEHHLKKLYRVVINHHQHEGG